MFSLFQLLEDADLDGDVQVWRHLAQRLVRNLALGWGLSAISVEPFLDQRRAV